MSIHRMESEGVELRLVGRKPTTIAGDPVESLAELYDDGRVSVGVWQCTPGSFTSFWDGRCESIVILAGDGTLTEEDGTAHELTPGAMFVMPAGTRATWAIRETLVKSYTVTQVAAS
ncbi:cupin domain-containing protein [Conexibacter arvalis]|uniref:(S)-ureidoglycine aminohydrolase cupin domain-containing protein n=1 Tax=Conexibacter arvalis TaxID=912552 RepID=A0A840IDJ6_9ACTN|nr:cupin domain-containing protein [Conexibacter arvalis]MBB4662108.1 hypothetical protein [Conexibacter arvalis]